MTDAPAAAQHAAARWFKSSYSAADNECVEISHTPSWVGIRDTKLSGRNGLTVSADTFSMFIGGLKRGPVGPTR
ncbi:DUF397 domain-containing protein [Streptomyces sp. PSKA30]|uniref:DUF397 domain-containing protein n=1 Tax=Streptomyces sp. PSKA30 TaxID=2874597 RepID=UPI001CD09819|nr:DUF397 domain-containing protein [Streptomyces sp. PSKA30]MBZ9643621.1 DUF397 domain-containing protein [Streptomyces sp. PSKA30]